MTKLGQKPLPPADSNIRFKDRLLELDYRMNGLARGNYVVYCFSKKLGQEMYVRDKWKSDGDLTFWTTYLCRARLFKSWIEAKEFCNRIKKPNLNIKRL